MGWRLRVYFAGRGLIKLLEVAVIASSVYINSMYLWLVELTMDTAKLFKTGRSQAVRLPKAFRMPGNEVKIRREGNKVILEPLYTSWDALLKSLDEFPEDFMNAGREQPKIQGV